jgi:hypothetical protein
MKKHAKKRQPVEFELKASGNSFYFDGRKKYETMSNERRNNEKKVNHANSPKIAEAT